MRAFTILFASAMFGAVSLAAVGAVSTISQTRHEAAFSLAGGIAHAQNGVDRASLAAVATPIAFLAVRRDVSDR